MRTWQSGGVVCAVFRPALWWFAGNLLVASLAATCTNPTQVPDGTYTTGDHSQVDNNALATTNFALSGGATATFTAGNCIDLAPGFHASAIGATVGTTFHAWGGYCANGGFDVAIEPERPQSTFHVDGFEPGRAQ